MTVQLAHEEQEPRRLTISLHDGGTALVWILAFDPPLEDVGPCEVDIGRSVARTTFIAHPFEDPEGQLLIAPELRGIAQLWHAHAMAHGRDIPVHVGELDADERPWQLFDAALASEELRQALDDTEQRHDLGLRTTTLTPPIYLEQFWARKGGRAYGLVDAMLADLASLDVVSDALLEKARADDALSNWAVVCPEGLRYRDEVLAALAPLIRHRNGSVLAFPTPAGASETSWFVEQFRNLPLEERPYYLLVLGDLDEVSMESQYFLQSLGAAGRLVFDDPEDYRLYAEKVISHEQDFPVASEVGPTYIAADCDDVNARNFEELVEALAHSGDAIAPHQLLAHGRAGKARVLSCLREVPEGSAVFISAHGFEHLGLLDSPWDDVLEDARHFHGAPILDDFRPPRGLGSTNGLLTAADVRVGRIAPRGVVVLHACHSAGTTTRDTQPEWIHLRMPSRLECREPFVSALAKALLANPDGPVAIFGHVNRSHQFGYFAAGPEDHCPLIAGAAGRSFTYTLYLGLLQGLMRGETLGLGRECCRWMTLEYMNQAMTLSYQIEWLLTGYSPGGRGWGRPRKGVGAYEQSFMAYSFATCNFRNYVIIGDPMVRLRPPDA